MVITKVRVILIGKINIFEIPIIIILNKNKNESKH